MAAQVLQAHPNATADAAAALVACAAAPGALAIGQDEPPSSTRNLLAQVPSPFDYPSIQPSISKPLSRPLSTLSRPLSVLADAGAEPSFALFRATPCPRPLPRAPAYALFMAPT